MFYSYFFWEKWKDLEVVCDNLSRLVFKLENWGWGELVE